MCTRSVRYYKNTTCNSNQRKLKYLGHAIRNPETDPMKISIQGKVPSKRSRGRPSTSLLNNIIQSSAVVRIYMKHAPTVSTEIPGKEDFTDVRDCSVEL